MNILIAFRIIAHRTVSKRRETAESLPFQTILISSLKVTVHSYS